MLLPTLLLLPNALALQIPLQRNPPPASSLLSPGFDSFARGLLAEWGVPGLALGVVKLDETGKTKVEFRNYGSAGRAREVNEDTLFGIASNSKAFVAAAIGQLVEQERLSWKDKLHDLLPDFELSDSVATKQTSLLDLLHDHSYRVGQSPAELVRNLKHLKPSVEFRESFQYNNQMYMAATEIVSAFTSQPYSSYVTSRIFKPLNMTASTFSPHLDGPAVVDRLSSSFEVNFDNKTAFEIPYGLNYSTADLELIAGPGGIVSSTRDMVKWVELLLRQVRRGKASDADKREQDAIVSPATVLQLLSAQTIAQRAPQTPFTRPMTFGLGLVAQSYGGTEYIYHTGGLPGFGSHIAWSPEAGVGVVALSQSIGYGNVVADSAAYRAFEDLVKREPFDWLSQHRRFFHDALKARDDALKRAQQHKPSISPTLHPDAYLGSFAAPGHGNVTVCPSAESARTTSSYACRELRERLSGALPISALPPSSPDPVFLLAWPGYFSASHILLRHYDGDVWKGAAATIFEGMEDSPGRKIKYGEADEVRVRFVVEGGEVKRFEVSGVWGAGEEVEKDEERAEVVFERQ
ncbi:hypothetical protein JCM6882_007738 [Rhodosporidiobolus microsporus]